MIEISGKSLHEIYKEDARKYKESIAKERLYSEAPGNLIGDFDKSEALTVTMPMEEFDKLQKLALSAHTDKLSVEKLQEQLNTAKYFFKNILDVNPNLKKGSYAHLSNCVNVMKNSAEKALAAIGGDDE